MHNKNSEACKAVLLSVSIVVDSDITDIQPDTVCNSCYIILGQTKKAKERGDATRDIHVHTWLPHTESCSLCSEESFGGRPKKRKVEGRPKDSVNYLRMVNSLHLTQLTDSSLHRSYFCSSSVLEDLVCKICSCVPCQPVEILSCRHFLCKTCIVSACETGSMSCPCNSLTLHASQLIAPSNVVLKLLESLLVRCTKGCGQVMELKHLRAHLTCNCASTLVPSPSNISVQQLLDQDHSSTPSIMKVQTLGLLLDEVLPASRSITCKTPSGKVSSIKQHFINIYYLTIPW